MTTELFRVVVVSRDPVPVTTVLRFKLPGCLPVAVPSVDDVATKLRAEAIVLVDLGDDGASLAAARTLRRQGIRHGIVVIGHSGTGGLSGVTGLQPPFQLHDLEAAMQRARDHSARAATSQKKSPTATVTAEEATVPGRGKPAKPSGSATDSVEPPPLPTPLRRGPSTTIPQAALDAVTSVDETLFSSMTPAHPGGGSGGTDSSAAPLRSKVERWRKRLTTTASAEPAEPTQRQLHERLVQIFAATSQIESIAAEMPIITDRAALYQAIVTAVADEFAADSVVLWRPGQDGWVAAAHLGLTAHQSSLVVGFEQPVLSDLEARGGAILLDPTVSFQALISGIGGAHRESFMACAVAIGSHRLGILAVGRDEPLGETDLDRLVELAGEAAVGIGVAEHIQRMADLVGETGGEGAGRERDPGQWREAFLDELKSAWQARREGDDDASAAEMWSALARPDDDDVDRDEHPGGEAADDVDTVIDLTSRASKRA